MPASARARAAGCGMGAPRRAGARPGSIVPPFRPARRAAALPRLARRLAAAWIVATWGAVAAAQPVAGVAAPPQAAAEAVREAAAIHAVRTVGMTVSDLDRSVAFFTGVLSFEKVSEVEVWGEAYEHLQGVFGLRMRIARLRLGDETLQLTEYLAPRGRPIPVDSRSNDRWFQHVAIIVSDMDKAYAHLRSHDVEHASTGPQRLPEWNPSAGGIEAFYFKDPDGHVLEVLRFPPGKGDPKWQSRIDRLFLGIDHTAIVVGDTDASLAFYRDRLGLRVAGESENYGTEQEHLNNVFAARLRITALRADAGPGIELLEYLAPTDGRPVPPDLRANDVAHWETMLATGNEEAASRSLPAGAIDYVSPGIIELPDERLGFRRALSARDPDGHVIQIVEENTRQRAPGEVGAR